MSTVSPTLAVNLSIAGSIQQTADIGSLQKTITTWPPLQPLVNFTAGVGANQIDTWFDDIRSLAGAANESLDLNGSLTDGFGNTVNLLHVKLLALYRDPLNTTDLTVGAGTNPFLFGMGGTTPTLTLKPGGLILLTYPSTGFPVVASTGDILKVANAAGATANYHILVGGTST
jgi:hypothetical protein